MPASACNELHKSNDGRTLRGDNCFISGLSADVWPDFTNPPQLEVCQVTGLIDLIFLAERVTCAHCSFIVLIYQVVLHYALIIHSSCLSVCVKRCDHALECGRGIYISKQSFVHLSLGAFCF